MILFNKNIINFTTNTLALICIIFVAFISSCTYSDQTIEEVYYQKLDTIRKTKHQELIQYMTTVKQVAESIRNDGVMKDLFVWKNNFYKKYKNTTPPSEVQHSIYKLRDAIENRYIDNYLIFYDILFVNNTGDIFYTVRRQSDYRKNIFEGELADTNLSSHLKNNPTKTFVDFQNYKISGEPAAFFVEPHFSGSEMLGWFVLQFSINKINDMFSIEEALGQTGEIFLVNKDSYMLTDSRFFAESTILRKHLSEDNIKAKFSERTGHLLVTDYRGYRAITSFGIVSLFNSEWLLIAKIDEDEILTKEYKKIKNKISPKLLSLAEQQAMKYQKTNKELVKQIEVDLDEFKRATNGESLYTHGVSTCTAFIISQKNKFAYLAHISAYDWLYGGNQTDVARRMLDRIEKFDVIQNEKRNIEIILISPNLPDTEKLIDALIEWGLFLSQIKLVNNPEARYANLSHNYLQAITLVEWKLKNKPGQIVTVSLSDTKSLGELLTVLKL